MGENLFFLTNRHSKNLLSPHTYHFGRSGSQEDRISNATTIGTGGGGSVSPGANSEGDGDSVASGGNNSAAAGGIGSRGGSQRTPRFLLSPQQSLPSAQSQQPRRSSLAVLSSFSRSLRRRPQRGLRRSGSAEHDGGGGGGGRISHLREGSRRRQVSGMLLRRGATRKRGINGSAASVNTPRRREVQLSKISIYIVFMFVTCHR